MSELATEEDVQQAVAALRSKKAKAEAAARESDRRRLEAEEGMNRWREQAVKWSKAKLRLEAEAAENAARSEYASRVLRLHATILLAQRELAKLIDAE